MKGTRFTFSDTVEGWTIQDNDLNKILVRARRKLNGNGNDKVRVKTKEEIIFDLRRELKAKQKFYESRMTPKEIDWVKEKLKLLGL